MVHILASFHFTLRGELYLFDQHNSITLISITDDIRGGSQV